VYQKERMDNIMKLLDEYGYTTVKFLCKELGYSTATINRDLNLMEKQKQVLRTYGGVERVESKYVPIPFRYHKMKTVKNKMGKIAAELVNDGDTIFIDASTTAEYMVKHLTGKKGITVITNNISIITYLSEWNINLICLGGKMCEPPSMLGGTDTVENAMRYKADKMFFSTLAISREGIIGSSDVYYLMHKVMAENSKEVYYMADHEKIDAQAQKVIFTLDDITGVITDYIFSGETKNKYKNTFFIEVTE